MTWPITPLASVHFDPTALATLELQFRAAYTALMKIFEKLPAEIIDALVNVILTSFGFGSVTGDAHTLLTALEAALQDIPQGNITGLVSDLSTAGSAFVQLLRDAICNALGVPGSGHTDADVLAALQNIPGSVVSGVTQDWQTALNALQLPTPTALVQQLPQSIPALVRDIEGGLSAVGGGLTRDAEGAIHFVEDGLTHIAQQADQSVLGLAQITQQLLHVTAAVSGPGGSGAAAAVANPGVADVMIAGQSAHTALTSAIEQAVGTVENDIVAGAAQLGGAVSGSVAQIEGAASVFAGDVAAGVGQLGNSIAGFFGGLVGAWTNGSTAAANAAAVNQAAAAAAAAAAYQAQQTAAINALTPHFYGGSGTSGLPLQSVTFTNSLPASFTLASTIAANSAVYNVATASTDQETVSAFWNAPLPTPAVGAFSDARYLFLRGNTGLTTYLYLKYYLEGAAFVVFGGSYDIPIVHVEIGCSVAGVRHVLDTASVAAPDSSLASLAFGPQAWGIEATGNAITITGPGGYSFSTIDGSPGGSPVVSQYGASYRSAGIGSDETLWLQKITDWNFYDSGPSVGPGRSDVATLESTGSTTFTNLATAHQDTVNIGASGMALVFISADASNDGGYSYMSYELSGANTRAASSSPAARGSSAATIILAYLETGLLPGPTTFVAKHKADSGHTANFENRHMSVTPL